MGTKFALNRLLGSALLLSLVLHGLGALMMPPFARLAAVVPVETISFTKVRRIEITHRAAPARNRPAARRVAVQPHPVAKPVPAPHLTRDARNTPPPAAAPAAQTVVAAVSRDAATASPAPPQPTPHATASAEARDVATTTNRRIASGYMPFGASEGSPVLDPSALKALVALNVHVTILVVVSDDGRTKSMRFEPAIDKALQGQIADLLGSANWDPAYCGAGIPCEAVATIKL